MSKVDFETMTEQETFDTVVAGMAHLTVQRVVEAIRASCDRDDLEELRNALES